MVFLVIIGLIMAIIAVLFAFQNTDVAAINFGVGQFEKSLAIILISTLSCSQNAFYELIANRFKNTIILNSFSGITDCQRFITLALGLRGTDVTKYAAYLPNKITESPLQKVDVNLVQLKMSVGGVIVDPTDLVDSRIILKQAKQNLKQPLEKGWSLLEISEVTSKTV